MASMCTSIAICLKCMPHKLCFCPLSLLKGCPCGNKVAYYTKLINLLLHINPTTFSFIKYFGGFCSCQRGVVQSTSSVSSATSSQETEHWCRKIDADHANPRSLRKSVDSFLDRCRMPASNLIDVETVNWFFAEKVSKVRSSTSDATLSTFSRFQPGVLFVAFSSANVDDVMDASLQLPD